MKHIEFYDYAETDGIPELRARLKGTGAAVECCRILLESVLDCFDEFLRTFPEDEAVQSSVNASIKIISDALQRTNVLVLPRVLGTATARFDLSEPGSLERSMPDVK